MSISQKKLGGGKYCETTETPNFECLASTEQSRVQFRTAESLLSRYPHLHWWMLRLNAWCSASLFTEPTYYGHCAEKALNQSVYSGKQKPFQGFQIWRYLIREWDDTLCLSSSSVNVTEHLRLDHLQKKGLLWLTVFIIQEHGVGTCSASDLCFMAESRDEVSKQVQRSQTTKATGLFNNLLSWNSHSPPRVSTHAPQMELLYSWWLHGHNPTLPQWGIKRRPEFRGQTTHTYTILGQGKRRQRTQLPTTSACDTKAAQSQERTQRWWISWRLPPVSRWVTEASWVAPPKHFSTLVPRNV